MARGVSPTSVRLDEQGRIVIPAKLRKQLRLETGDRLLITIDSKSIRMVTARSQLQSTRGVYRHLAPNRSLADELIAERHAGAVRTTERN